MFLISHVISLTNDNTGSSLFQIIVYLEYFFPLIFYFLFIVSFIFIILNNQKINLILKILLIINSFLLGFSAELANIPIMISIIILTVLISIFDKKLFKKDMFLIIIPFITGLILFYATSQYMQGRGGLSYDITLDANFYYVKNLHVFIDGIKYFIEYMFIKNIFYYLVILLLFFILIFKKNKNINIILMSLFSVILGYLITNFTFLIFYKELIARDSYQCIYQNILIFVIVILAGAVYYQFYKYKKHFIILFSVILIAMIISYNHYNKIFQKLILESKILNYKIEKICILYSLLGEPAILPINYFNINKDKGLKYISVIQDNQTEEEIMDFLFLMPIPGGYYSYFYKLTFIGYKFVNDNYANDELEKRLKIFGEYWDNDEEIKANNVSFKSLNKYKNFNLKLEDIEKIKETEENSYILLKAKAYIYYRNGDLKKALELYKESLNRHHDDYILDIILTIYSEFKQYDNIDDLLNKIPIQKIKSKVILNRCFTYYYQKGDINKALEINNQYMLGEISGKVNKILLLLKLGKKKEAEDVIKNDLSDFDYYSMKAYFKANNIDSLDDIKKETKLPLWDFDDLYFH